MKKLSTVDFFIIFFALLLLLAIGYHMEHLKEVKMHEVQPLPKKGETLPAKTRLVLATIAEKVCQHCNLKTPAWRTNCIHCGKK